MNALCRVDHGSVFDNEIVGHLRSFTEIELADDVLVADSSGYGNRLRGVLNVGFANLLEPVVALE